MPLTTRYRFANTPTPWNPSLGWTVLDAASVISATVLVVDDASALPNDGEFDLRIGLRQADGTTSQATTELAHVLFRVGNTITLDAPLSLAHAIGESVYHDLTELGLRLNPGVMEEVGDTVYMGIDGRPARLAAPSDGDYVTRWTSGVRSWVAVSVGTISGSIAVGQVAFAVLQDTIVGIPTFTFDGTDLIVPQVETGLLTVSDSSTNALLSVFENTSAVGNNGVLVELRTYGDVTAIGEAVLRFCVHKGDATEANVDISLPPDGSQLTIDHQLGVADGDASAPGYSFHSEVGLGFYRVSAGIMGATATSVVFSGTITATDFIVSGSRFKSDAVDTHTGGLAVYDVNAAAYRDFLVWTNADAPAVVLSPPTTGTLSGDFSTLAIGGASVATQTYVNAQGFVTAASSTAFTNKTGAISQWTNDSSYTTLAAVAGVGYLTSVTAHNLLSATHGDTTAGTVARGDVITGQGASATWARLAKGTANQVLAMDGTATDVIWATISAGVGTVTHTAGALTANALVLGNAAADITVMGSLGTTTTVLHGNAAGAPTFGAVSLTADVSGILPTANGGTGIAYFTAAGPTTARVYTFPDAAATIARTDAGQTFTGVQAFTAPTIATGTVITEAVGTSALVLTGATQVTSFPVISATQTWNASGTTFTALKLNVTSTASATASLLLDLQVAAATQFNVRKDGLTTGNAGFAMASGGTVGWSSRGGIAFPGDGQFQFFTNGFGANAILSVEATAVIQMGADVNGPPVHQTFKAHDGITGTNIAAANLTLAPGRGTGSGTPGALAFQAAPALGSGTTAQTLATQMTLTSRALTLADAVDLVFNATTGTKFGTATSQKLGFYNATPVIQRADMLALTDSTTGTPGTTLNDVGVVFSQAAINNNFSSCLTQINKVRTALRDLGLMA